MQIHVRSKLILSALAPLAIVTLCSQTVIAEEPSLYQPISFNQAFDSDYELCSATANSWSGGQHLLRFRGGLTYINRWTESHVGGTYGLEGILPVTDSFGGHAAARVNQFSGGTQVLGTLGGYRSANPCSGSTLDRIGGSVMLDLFGDFRGGDAFLSQLRAQAGYALSDNTAIGATMTTPLNQDDEALFLPAPLAGDRRAVNSGGLFVSRYFGEHLTYANVGYREAPDSLYIDLALRTPLVGDSVFAYANGNYIEDAGNFSSWLGVEVRFGRSRRGTSAGRRSAWDDPTIANSFNYGENSFWHNTNEPLGAELVDDQDPIVIVD